MTNIGESLERLTKIMARLRGEGGCPWDREQTLATLRPYLVEETYEVLDEMDRVSQTDKWDALCEELGDLLFQIVFHSQLASEKDHFTMADVATAISDKIESRHPHVFGERKVSGAEEVLANWAQLKAEEKKKKHGSAGSVLDGVPTAAPALLRAERLTEKASRIGFDWPKLEDVRAKLAEELQELDAAISEKNKEHIEHELGDVLFSLANLARFVQTPAEDALRAANKRFTFRFNQIEKGLAEQNVAFGKATLEQMESLWQKAKGLEKNVPPPVTLPRSGVARIEIVVANFETQRSFWQKLAPHLGWFERSSELGSATFSDGAMNWVFKEQKGAATNETRFILAAPSVAAVDAFSAVLNGLKINPQATRTSSQAAVDFVDPAGCKWSYRWSSI
jgi:nucleoside triphosphate diphosphatase